MLGYILFWYAIHRTSYFSVKTISFAGKDFSVCIHFFWSNFLSHCNLICSVYAASVCGNTNTCQQCLMLDLSEFIGTETNTLRCYKIWKVWKLTNIKNLFSNSTLIQNSLQWASPTFLFLALHLMFVCLEDIQYNWMANEWHCMNNKKMKNSFSGLLSS